MAKNNKPQNNKPQNNKPQNNQASRPQAQNNQASRPQAQRNNKQSSNNDSLKIDRNDVINNPGKYDNGYNRDVAAQNPSSVIYQGLYGGGLSDGEGGTHKLQGFHVPGAGNGIGPAGDVLFAAGPNANQEWLNANFGVGGRYYKAPTAEQTAAASSSSSSSSSSDSKKYESVRAAIKSGDRLSMGQMLRIASGSGNGTDLIDKREFNRIHKYLNGHKSGLDILDRVDKINTKQGDKRDGFNPMGLQSDVFGRISKGKYGDSGYAQLLGQYSSKHQGPLSQLVLNYKGGNHEGVKGFGVYGRDAHGNAIFSPGQGGRSWSGNHLIGTTPTTETPTTPTTPTTPSGDSNGSTTAPTTPTTPSDSSSAPSFSIGGYGAGGEKNALTFRQNKSRWKQDGRSTKGTSGLRFNRQSGFGGFGTAAGVSASVF